MEDRLARLEALVSRASYRGHDPFDLVNSPFLAPLPANWSLPQLFVSKTGARLAPAWLRAVLRVPLIEDPKTYTCMYVGYAARGDAAANARAAVMLDRLEALAGPGGNWGYDFLWPTRTTGTNP